MRMACMALNLWVKTILGLNDSFLGISYQIFTLRFIAVEKLQNEAATKLILWFGISTA